MKWIGQHIYDQISRFRDDVYLEDISTGVIVSGAHLGLDSNNKIVKAVDSANLTGHVTSLGNVTTLAATQPAIESIGTDGDSLSILGDTLIMQNTTTNKPEIQLINFVDDTTGPRFSLTNKRKSSGLTPTGIQPGQDSDTLGTIIFQGYDSQPLTQDYAAIIASIHEAASDEESGKLALRVANHDGGLGSGLVMSGGLRDDEVNVTIGLGPNSVVTIPGDIDLAGDIDVDGTLEVDAFKGTGATTITNILDEDAMGSDSATALATQQSIKAYADTKVSSAATKQVTHHMIKDAIGAGVVYISLGEIDAESGSKSNKNLPLLAPVDGKLLKIFVRSTTDVSGEDFTWKLLTRAVSATTAGNSAIIGTAPELAGPTDTTMVTYDFTSVSSNVINEGDKVQISVQATDTTSDSNYFITCLWEWDLS